MLWFAGNGAKSVQEADHSRGKQGSGGGVVCVQAPIGEQVPVTGIEEKLAFLRSRS
jgi:hypothetical protein